MIKIEQTQTHTHSAIHFLLIPIQTIQIEEQILHSTQMFGQTHEKETRKPKT